ncbi:MAG: peptide deformylase [Coriobacteriales bacterium]|jgi:peptide deformylase|nr:peptide deformylase [Coriobacteriales bacterium]
MQIIIEPNPILNQVSEPVSPEELPGMRRSAEQMAEVMAAADGVGLAAIQVGLPHRLFVVDGNANIEVEEGEPRPEIVPLYFINPEVVRSWGKPEEAKEGCLSIPGISVPITRPSRVEIKALDLDGKPFTIKAKGFLARALQHEYDHLDGITMFERLDPITRLDALRSYADAQAEAGAA